MRHFIWLVLFSLFTALPLNAIAAPTVEQISKELKQAEDNTNIPNQPEVVASYQRTLNWLNELSKTQERAKEYQKIINNYQQLYNEYQQRLADVRNADIVIDRSLTVSQVEQRIIQVNSQLLELNQQVQKKQDELREVSELITQFPILQSQNNKAIFESEQRLRALSAAPKTVLDSAKITELQAEVNYNRAYTNELALNQLSAPNRQTLLQLQVDALKAEYENVDKRLKALREQSNQLRHQKQLESELLAKELNELDHSFPKAITEQFALNQALSDDLTKISKRRDEIAKTQQEIFNDTQEVRNTFNALREQAEWLSMSTTLGEIQRAQIARLPKAPKSQQFDNEMAELRAKQLSLQKAISQLDDFNAQFDDYRKSVIVFNQQKKALNVPDDGSLSHLSTKQQQKMVAREQELLATQNRLLSYVSDQSERTEQIFNTEQLKLIDQQINRRSELLNSLLTNSEMLIVELTQLKILTSQLNDALSEVKEAAHRYLFWAADSKPIGITYPIDAVSDLTKLISLNTIFDLSSAVKEMVTTPETLGLLFLAVLLVVFHFTSHKHYIKFLDRSSQKVGRVTQDSFSLTLKAVVWSIFDALPLPILWGALSFGLTSAWQYPIAVALGSGLYAALPIMWAFMICASFAHPNGLFIAHFCWSENRVTRAMRYYKLTVWAVIPMIVALISFENYNDREFASTLGRGCFFLLCAVLVLMANSLHKAGVPLYLDEKGTDKHVLNDLLWMLLRYSPIAAALAAAFGYFTTSQALLARLEFSVIIWFALLIIYHIIRRLMLIQRRRIEFERAKQRRADRLAQRAKSDEERDKEQQSSGEFQEIEEPVVNLDEISAQSLSLIRSIIGLIAVVSIIILWSEIHSAFSFLENVRLWEIKSNAQGVNAYQPVTLGKLFIVGLVFLITAQLVRNLPALLELAVLQHLTLNPGTGYAIITLTKYGIFMVGCSVALSMVGLNWEQIQLVIAALGVGIGIGLQEIFANFISGLILLFEKPIRIGDMVTIRGQTGTTMKINTRATTIVDWDRKEIVIPNKAFITEPFTNWSLSDSITRIVTTVPADIDADPTLVVKILLNAAENCALVLETPQPEAFLMDIQQGIQIFELRVYAGETAHRNPIRNELHGLILKGYKEHNLSLPFPPFQMRTTPLNRSGVIREPRVAGDN